MTPTNRKYTKEHEWLMAADGSVMVGITDHAQKALGDIVYVELPAIGDTFESGDSFAVVESIKAVSNVYSAISGEIIAINDALENSPELINEAPYDNFIAVFSDCPLDGYDLLSADEYDAFVAKEE